MTNLGNMALCKQFVSKWEEAFIFSHTVEGKWQFRKNHFLITILPHVHDTSVLQSVLDQVQISWTIEEDHPEFIDTATQGILQFAC